MKMMTDNIPRFLQRAGTALMVLVLLLQPCPVRALAPASELKQISHGIQRRLETTQRIKAFLATIRSRDEIGPNAKAPLNEEDIEILCQLTMVLDPQDVERGIRSQSFTVLKRIAERLKKMGMQNIEFFLRKFSKQIPPAAFSKAFGDQPEYGSEILEILYTNSERLPWLVQLLGADAVAAAISGKTLNTIGAMKDLLPLGPLKNTKNIADTLGMSRSEFAPLFARDPKRLSPIALSLSRFSAAHKKVLFDVFPRSSYLQAMLQNPNEFQIFLDAMLGMKADQFGGLMAEAKKRDADLQQKFENNPDTFLVHVDYAGMSLHAWAAEHEERQGTQTRRTYRGVSKDADLRAIIKKAFKSGRFQILEQRNEMGIASSDMGNLIDPDDDDRIMYFSTLIGGARHAIDFGTNYPYKRVIERMRFVAVEGFPLDAWYDEGALSGGFPTIYLSWDLVQAYADRVKSDDDSETNPPKEELADIAYRLVTEHQLAREFQVQEGIGPEEAASKARVLVENYGDAARPFFSEEKRNRMIQARERITRVLEQMDKEAALKNALAELQSHALETTVAKIPPGVPAPEILQQLLDTRIIGAQRAPRDYSTTASGNDLEMTYAEHEAIIDPFIQRAAKEGKITYLSPRSPPAQEILAFLQWLGERSGRTELPSLFETLLTIPKQDSPTQVKWVYASSTNPLPVFKGETIVGHAGDHGIYAFIGDSEDERLTTQRLVHEFGARLSLTHKEFNQEVERTFAAWQQGEWQGEKAVHLFAMLQQNTKPFEIPMVMTKTGPRDYAARKKWTREKVLEAVRERETAGKPLDFKTMRTKEGGLYQAASTLFKKEGGYSGALKEIGKTEDEIAALSLTRIWTKQKIIDAIKKREKDKKSLNSADVQKDDGGLFMTALKFFKKEGKKIGNWDDVLRALGKSDDEIARIRVRRPPWTRDTVIEEICQREIRGDPLNSSAVGDDDSGLLDAAVNLFKSTGGWEGALKAAGKTDEQIASIRLIRAWSREKIIEAIQKRDTERKPLNASSIQTDDSGLYYAGKSFFENEGGWDGALRAAGKTTDEINAIRLAHDRSKEAILETIRRRKSEGKPLNSKAVDSGLRQTATKMFRNEGGWDGALKAAGIPMDEIALIRLRAPKWTKKRVVDAIQKRVRERKPLNVSSVLEEGEDLYRAARRSFKTEGCWEGALRAAGLDPDKIYKTPKSLREKIGSRGKILPQNVTTAITAKFKIRRIQDVVKELEKRLEALNIEMEEITKRSRLEIAILDIQRSGKNRKQLELSLARISEGMAKGDFVAIETAGHTAKNLKVQDVWDNKVILWLGDEALGEVQDAKLVSMDIPTDLRLQIQTVKQLRNLLEQAMAKGMERLGLPLWDVLLGLEAPPQTRSSDLSAQKLAWLDEDITDDDSQKIAVEMALNEKSPVQIIWGPPGTGKTNVIAEIARQFARRGKRVLIVSQMNQAVDVALARIMADEDTVPLLRLGNDSEAITDEFVQDLWVGNQDQRKSAVAAFLGHPENGIIVGATSVGVSVDHELDRFPARLKEFDIVIMDEASRERWGGASIPFFRAKEKIVIVGDPKQLPPLEDFDVKKVLEQKGFDPQKHYQGVLDDFVDKGYDQVMLSTNYRSHPLIAGLTSQLFYGNRVGTRELEEDPIREDTVKVIDTSKQSQSAHEIKESADELSNPFEARLVVGEVKRLLQEGLKPDQITIITPYAKQVEKIRQELAMPENGFTADTLELLKENISTVDSFQGGENIATIVSFVRSNKERPNVGFLKDLRRLNVALSRGKERLIIVGDMDTLKNTRRTPADLEVGRIFTELEKYNEEIVKPTVAVAKASETKAYLNRFGQAQMNPKIREAFDVSGQYQVLDQGETVDPSTYGAFGMGRLIDTGEAAGAKEAQGLQAFIVEAKALLEKNKKYPYKQELKKARIVAVRGLPPDGHYGSGGMRGHASAYLPWDRVQNLWKRHLAGDTMALPQMSDFIYHEVTEPQIVKKYISAVNGLVTQEEITAIASLAHKAVSEYKDNKGNPLVSGSLEKELSAARRKLSGELKLMQQVSLEKNFGQRMKSVAIARGLDSVEKRAAAFGVSGAWLRNWESTDTLPSPAVLDRIAEVLDFPKDILAFGKEFYDALREPGLTESKRLELAKIMWGWLWKDLKMAGKKKELSLGKALKIRRKKRGFDVNLIFYGEFLAERIKTISGMGDQDQRPGNILLATMFAKGLTPEQVSRRSGVSVSKIRDLMYGHRKIMPRDVHALAKKGLKTTDTELLFGRTKEKEFRADPSRGSRFRKARYLKGWGLEELARQVGTGAINLSRIENDKPAYISVEAWTRLLKLLEMEGEFAGERPSGAPSSRYGKGGMDDADAAGWLFAVAA